jgi:hypothetical protein
MWLTYLKKTTGGVEAQIWPEKNKFEGGKRVEVLAQHRITELESALVFSILTRLYPYAGKVT